MVKGKVGLAADYTPVRPESAVDSCINCSEHMLQYCPAWLPAPGAAVQTRPNQWSPTRRAPTSFLSSFCASSISKRARRCAMDIGTAGFGTKGAGWAAAGWAARSGATAAFPGAAGPAAGAAPTSSGSSHGVLHTQTSCSTTPLHKAAPATKRMWAMAPLTRLALPTAQAARRASPLVPMQLQAAAPALRVRQPAAASTPSAFRAAPASCPAHCPLLVPGRPA